MRGLRVARVLGGWGVFGALAIAAVPPALAESDIGTTMVVVRTVTGTLETQVRQLVIHDNVAQNELIATGPDAASEIQFVDGTKLSLGPRAHVVLDKFVYDPNPSKGKFFLRVSEGVFRFATGHMDHQSYQITTPNGTLGVRGTEFNFIVFRDRTIVQVLGGVVIGRSFDRILRSYGRGAYFTMTNGTGPSSDNDKSVIDTQVSLMDTLLGGTQFAGGPPPGNEGTHPFQPFFHPVPPPPSVSPTLP
jgi:ferric-dicitrate binding protein FerR (iron transport regulator)